MIPIAPHISAWLQRRLPVERGVSKHTCDAYATTFQLLIVFVAGRFGIAPSELVFEQLDVPNILDFLEHLARDRGNSARTRNSRLAAVKSFMHFMEHREPAALDQIRRVLAIPYQRLDVRPVPYLTPDEAQAVLDAPDPSTRSGTRDRALLHIGITGGLRVSELVGLRVDELAFRDRYLDLHIRGKGRKERVLTLWKVVGDSVRAWLAIRGDAVSPEVFLNARGQALTRSGAEYVLRKHVATARKTCPSLATKRVSPHVLRHTAAMNTLRATRDIRKVSLWLGHASTQSTEVYLTQDPTERLETLEAVVPPSLRPGSFNPPDKLLELLRKR